MGHKTSFPIQNLSLENVEDILFRAEDTARKYIQSQIPAKELKNLNILIELNDEELTIDCIIDLELVKKSTLNPQNLTDEAIQRIFSIIESEMNNGSQ